MARSNKTSAGARALANQEAQKKKKKVAKRKKAEEDYDSKSEDSGRDDEVEVENQRLKSQVHRLQMATQLNSKTKTGRAKKGAPGAGSAETASVTKFWLWKRAKFLKDETQNSKEAAVPSL